MSVKNILGLDFGTNSIGWALVTQEFENQENKVIEMTTTIIQENISIKKPHRSRAEKSSAYSLIVICTTNIKTNHNIHPIMYIISKARQKAREWFWTPSSTFRRRNT